MLTPYAHDSRPIRGLEAEALQLGPCQTSLPNLAHIVPVAVMAATDTLLVPLGQGLEG
ncbi:hypothetical protein AB0M19_10485 [Streptomyces sp. NPDC051920]|uniref:hypothetical protein n=1 Tax=Streptomyces sp. NPDC051920 TaxID=3155523 RepID=UPI003419CB2F